MAEGADETIDVLVQLRDELSRQAAKVESAIDGVRNASAKAAPVVDELGDQIDDAGDAAATAAVQTAAYERELKKMTRQAAKAAAANALLQKRVDMMSGHGNKKRGMFGALTASMNLMGFLKMSLIPVILDAISAVSTLGGALGAMASAGVGALAPIVGIAGVLPGALTSLLQVFGVGKLAFGGIGDAIKNAFSPASAEQAKKFAESMKVLPPAARNFVLSLSKFKVPMKELKTSIQNALLPAMTRLMQTFRGYMPMVKTALTDTARVMAVTVGGFNRYFKMAETQKDVGTILGNNTKTIAIFGRIAQSGVKILVDLLVAAGPLLIRMAGDAERFFAALAFKSGNRNGLAEWMDRGYVVFQKTMKFIEDLWMALQNISKIGVPLGHEMGDSFLGMAKNFRHFTESESGVAKIANWFKQMRPVIYETGLFVAAIGKGLAHLSMDKTVVNTLRSLRTDTLPNIISMIESAAGRFLPAIAKMLGSILNIVTNLFVLPSLMEMIATSLNSIAVTIQKLPPPIKSILSLMLTLTTLFKVSGTIGFFKAIIGSASGAGAAGAATKVGFLTKAVGGMKTMFASSLFAVQAFRGGAAKVGEAAKYAAAPLARFAGLLKFGIVGAIAAMGFAVVSGNSALEEMTAQVNELFDAFAKAPSSEGIQGMTDKITELQGRVENFNSHNKFTQLFDSDTWSNWWNETVADFNTDNFDSEQWKGGFTDVAQVEIDRLKAKTTAYNNAINEVARNTHLLGTDLSSIFTELKIDPTTMSVEDLTRAVTSYVWINREADAATRTIAVSLKTMASDTATATEKVDAFSAALDAMQPTAKTLKSTTSTATRGLNNIADAAIKAAKSLPKVGEEMKITPNTKDSILDLNDALYSQVKNIDAVAAAAYEETGTIKGATDAYYDQYVALVSRVKKGYTEAGMGADAATAAAKSLVSQYALTPNQVRTAFSTPGVQQALEAGATWEEILAGIPKTKTTTFKISTTPETPWDVSMINYVTGDKKLEDPGVKIQVENAAANLALDTTLDKLKQIDRTHTATVNVNPVYGRPARFAGGPVWPGTTFTVGERGPELFIGNDGTSTMVGEGGQEQRRFPTEGFIVPNNIVADAASATMTDGNGSSRGTSGSYSPEPLPNVVVGPVYVNDSVDLQDAVAKGIALADKNRRERKGGR